jgi:hypothetical protein
MKFQSIAYLLNEREHIYWILNLEGEVHLIWDLWISDLRRGRFNVPHEGRSQWRLIKFINLGEGQYL